MMCPMFAGLTVVPTLHARPNPTFGESDNMTTYQCKECGHVYGSAIPSASKVAIHLAVTCRINRGLGAPIVETR